MNRRALFMPLLPLLVAIPARAQLGGGVFECPSCASETTSLATYARQALQLAQEAQTATQAIQMAQMMVREGVNLAQHPTTNIAADLGMLQSVLMQSTQLAGSMAQMNAAFNATYHAYDPAGVNNFAQAYNNWAANTLKTLNGAVNAAGYQGQMLQNEAAWTQAINLLNQTPQGRDQALQLGNTIGTQQVGQLQALRQLMLTDMSAKSAFMANQVTVQAAGQTAVSNTFGYATPVASGKVW
jgi:P-type conjugative transfer protein TrbJ